MSTKSKIFLADARLAAEAIVQLLEPACERSVIAGSIRRQAALVGDIEILCQPRLGPHWEIDHVSDVDRHVEWLMPAPKGTLAFDNGEGMPPDCGLRWNSQKPANGRCYKRLIWVGQSGPVERIPVDLFCVLAAASWGALLAIRTGPAEFSRGLVTQRGQGGAMPHGMQQRDGALWGPAGKIQTPEEEDYFVALGLPYWPPEERSAERLEEYLAGASPAD